MAIRTTAAAAKLLILDMDPLGIEREKWIDRRVRVLLPRPEKVHHQARERAKRTLILTILRNKLFVIDRFVIDRGACYGEVGFVASGADGLCVVICCVRVLLACFAFGRLFFFLFAENASRMMILPVMSRFAFHKQIRAS